MLTKIKSILQNFNIDHISIIDIQECDIINERILPDWAKSVIMFAIPYRSSTIPANDGFSEYARVYDYHKFSSELYDKITVTLTQVCNHLFKGFCDHSPINEKLAAAKSGLGFIGRNSLFFDYEYGSFVFLGSIITDYVCATSSYNINFCMNCGLCIDACPNSAILDKGIDRNKCLSGISQKKKKTHDEVTLLKENNIVWGCDICQNVCPHNQSATIKPLPYFKETRISNINKDFIIGLSDDEFNKYAFSYKGRQIVLDNVDFKDINP